ncbi:MAG: M48 family metalloprotease [Caulobacteraceae bacterium]
MASETVQPSSPRIRDRRRPWLAATAVLVAAGSILPFGARAQDEPPMSLIRDTEIEEILHQECDPVFIAAGLDPKQVTIHIVGDKEINAFTPGGLDIFVDTGLISETKVPNELIGVVAHETGHVAGGHIARSGEGQKSALRTFLITMGLGIAAAAAGAPDAAAGLLASSSYFATLDYLGFSRIQEDQADQAAATYLDRAGYSGKGLVDFFDHFRYEEVFSHAKQYPFFQSHPLTSDRIEALRVRVEKLPHYGAVDTPEMIEEHKIMIAKLKAFVNPPNQTFIDYKESDTSYPARSPARSPISRRQSRTRR